ncbi:nucleoside recognition domain-containing protein [Anaerobacillus isosaccharinicus]|uniref:Nucleoside recognition domain-containing protein n=1 Tax=Anaerobacillus isosaccharinicus TaxID=1532552 RepID=A0A1S2MEH9_9BACI|nr:nucleoside recognition domain-containing protein [Anaerobacillus isosaccharinicus]MBA5584661.1 nucleoside recognition domain-containing protein [Anaerobacillus isosaccharinicus]QOY36965.1 nucleoside recognition domain-containing protein [Anaerobacillus isosaccharinicus]
MGSLKRGLLVGLQTTWTLGKIIFPITLLVTIIGYTPLLNWLAQILSPVMNLIGLSGEAAIPLVLGNVLNLYAAIGAILTLDLSVKEVFILAVMLSFSHNLLVESAVATKVGIRMSVVLGVRIGLALFSAAAINFFWDGGSEKAQYGLVSSGQTTDVSGWGAIIYQGLESATLGVFQLALIVIPIMVGIQIMKDLNWLSWFSKAMSPFTKMLGMKENTSTTLAAGLVFGLAYGAGVMMQAVKEDGVKKKDLYLAFIFLVACHAVIEDTLLFIPLGIPIWPLFLIRLVTAIVLTILVAFVWNRLEKKEKVEEGKENVEYKM